MPNRKGIAWFRFVVEADTTLWRQLLGLIIQADGAAEFYLDGRLVHRSGKVGTSKAEETPIYHNPGFQIISFHPTSNIIANKSQHQIAVRYSNFFLESPIWSGHDGHFRWYFCSKDDNLMSSLNEDFIAIKSGNVTLAAELDLPPGEGSFPAMVFVHGSSRITRHQYVGMAKWLAS